MDRICFVLYIAAILITVCTEYFNMLRNMKEGNELHPKKKRRALNVALQVIICLTAGSVSDMEAIIGIIMLVIGAVLLLVFLKRKNRAINGNDPVMLGFYDIELKSVKRELIYVTAAITLLIFVFFVNLG